MLRIQRKRGWCSPTSLVELIMLVLAIWEIVVPPYGVLVASQCDNALALAYLRIERSTCGSTFPFTCPDTMCLGNTDGMGGESATCNLETPFESNGIIFHYLTVGGWSPGDPFSYIPPMMSEGTRVELSGSVEGSAQILIFSSYDCSVQVNDQDCSCNMVYCNGDESNAVVQANCTNLGQGTLDGCDTENFGNPGDILKYINLVETVCAEVASGEGTSSEGGTTTDGETTSESNTPTGDTSGGGETTSDVDGGTATEGAPASSDAASKGFTELARMQDLRMLLSSILFCFLPSILNM